MVRVVWLLVLLAVSVTSTEKIRGVNLGGWLVLEPWITPKLFEKANDVAGWAGTGPFIVYDEWTAWSFVATHPSIGDSIESHWESWVTQEHLQTLRDAGVNHLRVPVGYWYFEQGLTSRGEPFANGVDRFPKALSYLERMVNEWAKPLGLRVLLDLHTAPGSQNGFDNSGKRGGINMLNGDNTTRWEAVVGELSKWATEKLDADTLWGVEVLNEPAGFYPWMWSAETATINPKGYQAVRGANNDTNVIFQTGFHPLDQQPQYAEPEYHNTWFDDHNYQAFGDMWNELAWQPDGWATHLDKTCAQTQTYSQAPMPTVVGEFSLAVTDCTIYLASGMNGGCDMTADPSCRYAPTPTRRGHQATCDYYNQPAAELAKDYTEFLAEFARAQMDSFEAANGWFFWNFRTEDEHAPAWDFLLGLKQGWIAQNVSQRERFCP